MWHFFHVATTWKSSLWYSIYIMFSHFPFPACVWWFHFLLLSSSSHIFLPSKTFLGATIRAGAAFQEHQALDDEVWPEHQAFQEQRDLGPRSLRRDPGCRSATQVFLSLIWWVASLSDLNLIWWVVSLSDLMGFWVLFYLFLNLDFRWLLGVDLVGCFGWSVFVFCTPTLAEISWNFKNKLSLWTSIYKLRF